MAKSSQMFVTLMCLVLPCTSLRVHGGAGRQHQYTQHPSTASKKGSTSNIFSSDNRIKTVRPMPLQP